METDCIELVGIRWDKENLSVAGKEHFTWRKAQKAAEAAGKRLPTLEEWEALRKLPRAWDEELKGMWFAESKSDLKNQDKSLFLPADGYMYNSDGALKKYDYSGYYWSMSSSGSIGAYVLGIGNNSSVYMGNHGRTSAFSVRCVTEHIQTTKTSHPEYNKKGFLLPDSIRSCSNFHAKILPTGEYMFRIHDCITGIRLRGDLNNHDECVEASTS